jgi:uncharacterized protein (TIGR02646 family)
MIQFKKTTPQPKVLSSDKVKKARSNLIKIAKKRKPVSDDIPSHWLDYDMRKKAWRDQHKKCCYCERHRDWKREPDIEHYRPKGKVDKDTRHQGYWWLAYTWSNLLFSCKRCNAEYKKTQFPLRQGGTRSYGPTDKLDMELPWLINPSKEDPESCLSYDWVDGAIPLAKPIGCDPNGRGSRTIEILGLDEDEINEERGRELTILRGIQRTLDAALALPQVDSGYKENAKRAVYEATRPKQRFAGFRRAYFKKVGLGEYICSD